MILIYIAMIFDLWSRSKNKWSFTTLIRAVSLWQTLMSQLASLFSRPPRDLRVVQTRRKASDFASDFSLVWELLFLLSSVLFGIRADLFLSLPLKCVVKLLQTARRKREGGAARRVANSFEEKMAATKSWEVRRRVALLPASCAYVTALLSP